VRSDGRIRLLPQARRDLRYQIARFCEWQGFSDGFYRYRVTPASLERARSQGLRTAHLLSLLNKHVKNVPPALVTAVKRWDSQGSLAHFEQVVVLRVRNPELISALRATPASRFLGETLGPAAVIVKGGAWEKVASALAELGYLSEARFEIGS